MFRTLPFLAHKIVFAAEGVLKQLRGVSINSLFIGKECGHDAVAKWTKLVPA